MATVREIALELFRAHGMTTVFGNPGSTELPMLQQLPDDFRYVLGPAGGGRRRDGRRVRPGHRTAGAGQPAHRARRRQRRRRAGQRVRERDAAGRHGRAAGPADDEPRGAAHEPGRDRCCRGPRSSSPPSRPRRPTCPAVLARAIHVATTPPLRPGVRLDPDGRLGRRARPGHRGGRPRRAAAGCTSARPRTRRDSTSWSRPSTARRRPALVVGGDVDATGGFHDAVALAERLGAAVFGPPADGRVGFPTDHPLFQGALPMAIAPVAEALEPLRRRVVLGDRRCSATTPTCPAGSCPRAPRLLHVTADPDQAARRPDGRRARRRPRPHGARTARARRPVVARGTGRRRRPPGARRAARRR